MRYQVPQFIEVEDKIFGPLTLKQFIYLVGGVGMSFVLWRLLPLPIAIFFILLVMGFSAGLAFYRVNNRPFVLFLESLLKYVFSKRLYLWNPKRASEKKEVKKEEAVTQPPTLSEGRLRDLAWSLDVHTSLEGPRNN